MIIHKEESNYMSQLFRSKVHFHVLILLFLICLPLAIPSLTYAVSKDAVNKNNIAVAVVGPMSGKAAPKGQSMVQGRFSFSVCGLVCTMILSHNLLGRRGRNTIKAKSTRKRSLRQRKVQGKPSRGRKVPAVVLLIAIAG